jgi:pterin-4a-carbinolamine dehydratase
MMKLITEVMEDYWEPNQEDITASMGMPSQQKLPVCPVTFEWERVSDPDRLMRQYEFDTHQEYASFLSELMDQEAETDHFAKITAEFPKVTIEVYTHDVNQITELDLEYAHAADDIRKDVTFYRDEERYDHF